MVLANIVDSISGVASTLLATLSVSTGKEGASAAGDAVFVLMEASGWSRF
jgi:hypothetical protein